MTIMSDRSMLPVAIIVPADRPRRRHYLIERKVR